MNEYIDDNCILNYEFGDDDINEVHMHMGQRVALYYDGGHIQLCEEDVIALNKHYNINQTPITCVRKFTENQALKIREYAHDQAIGCDEFLSILNHERKQK